MSSKCGVDALLGCETLPGLALDDPTPQAGRLSAEAAYGFPVFGGRFTGTAYLDIALGVEGTRRVSWDGSPEHGTMLRLMLRW